MELLITKEELRENLQVAEASYDIEAIVLIKASIKVLLNKENKS